MKKILIVSILLAFSFYAAFAQEDGQKGWVFAGEIQVSTDVIHFTKASGKLETASGGVTDVQEWGKNIDGSLTVLNSSRGPAPSFWSAIYINYFGENVEFGIQMDLYNFFRRGAGKGSTGGSLLTGTNVKWLNILDAGFNEWYLKGNAGIFDGYVGNTGYGGYVKVYDNFTDWLSGDLQLESFYVNKMGDHQGSNNMDLWGGGSAFAIGASFTDSIRFAVGTDFGYGGDDNRIDQSYAWKNPFASANAFNAGVMFSGREIADLVSFDLFYGMFGYDVNTNARGTYNITAPDLTTQAGAAYHNVFGAYAGLSVMNGLGISVGYSGNVTIYEKQAYNKSIDPAKPDFHAFDIISPLWSSVHLHVNFTGIDNLSVTFNNNISFAGVKSAEIITGSDYDSVTLGLADGGLSSGNAYKSFAGNFTGHKKGEEESWFGYDTALQLSYIAGAALNISFQAANRLGVYTYSRENFTSSRLFNSLAAVLNAQYSIGNVTVGAGLSFGLDTTIYSAEAGNKTADGTNNIFKIGIPVVFKVVF